MELVVATVVALSTASLLVGRSRHHRDRWVSPYSVERAALQKVTRSEPTDFHPSHGVVTVALSETNAKVVSFTSRRDRVVAQARQMHPSNYRPAS